MQFATAGAAHLGSSSINTSVSSQFAFKLTGADVMHWQPKSRLQQIVDRLIQAITQPGNPQ